MHCKTIGIKQKQYIVSGFLREPGLCPSRPFPTAHVPSSLATAPTRRQRGPKPALPPSHPYRLRSIPGRIRNLTNFIAHKWYQNIHVTLVIISSEKKTNRYR